MAGNKRTSFCFLPRAPQTLVNATAASQFMNLELTVNKSIGIKFSLFWFLTKITKEDNSHAEMKSSLTTNKLQLQSGGVLVQVSMISTDCYRCGIKIIKFCCHFIIIEVSDIAVAIFTQLFKIRTWTIKQYTNIKMNSCLLIFRWYSFISKWVMLLTVLGTDLFDLWQVQTLWRLQSCYQVKVKKRLRPDTVSYITH